MCRHFGVVVSATLFLTAIACSHQPKPVAAMGVVSSPSKMPEAPRASQAHTQAPKAETPFAQASKTKEDRAIFFDFDSAQLRDEAHPVLQKVASSFKGKDHEKVRIEGNCDQLGTVEYNLALGEHRALAAKDYLLHLGVPRERIATVSYGSQRPKYSGMDEADRQKNRRDDLVVTR